MPEHTDEEKELPDLPRPAVTFADHSYPAYSAAQMKEFALAAMRRLSPAPQAGQVTEAMVEAAARSMAGTEWDALVNEDKSLPRDAWIESQWISYQIDAKAALRAALSLGKGA